MIILDLSLNVNLFFLPSPGKLPLSIYAEISYNIRVF
jgi:hypothetical protein